jgi:hypothetical protein
MNAELFKFPLIGCLVICLAGCSQATAPSTPESATQPSSATAEITETQTILEMPTKEDDMPTQWDDMPKDPPLTLPKSPGPQVLIERVKVDLAQRLSIPASQIKTMEAKEVSWPDASLGCPQPDITYAQIPTPGYLVVLEYAGNNYEYHASIRGAILYCENPTPPN